MLIYLVRRLVLAIAVVAAISFLSFWTIASKINPLWSILLFGNAETRKKIPAIEARAHLHASIPERWWIWIKGIFGGGDAGHTIVQDLPIWPPVWHALQQTAQLAAASLVVVALFSLLIGTIAAHRPGSALDVLLRGFGYLTWSIPVFLMALGLRELLLRLAVHTHGGFDPLYLGGPPGGPRAGTGFHYALDWVRHMALPVLTISFTFVGALSRYVRSSMLVALHAPYAEVARAKGLSERRVVVRHALRNSLIPFVSVLTLDFGNVISASFVADVIFQQGGLGSLWVFSINEADPFRVEAVLMASAVSVVVLSVLGDLVYGWLDPRIRIA